MGNNTTSGVWRAGALLLLAVVSTACDMGQDPDPRVIAAAIDAQRPRSQSVDEGPMVVVAAFDAGPSAPAPAVETAPRSESPQRQELLIAVGRNATPTVDATLAHAFATACPDLAVNQVACGDRDAVELLMVARADFAVIGGQLSQREQHAGLRQTRIGVELFALATAPNSPVRSLSRTQVRQVLTGEVTHWQQLGFEGGAIVVVVPADRSMAERAARALIPGDTFASTAVAVASERHVADQILQHEGAIAIVRILDHPMEAGQKLLQIDWCPPTGEAFDYGTYPFGQPVQLITSGQPSGAGLRFLEFARGDDGRELFGRTLLLR